VVTGNAWVSVQSSMRPSVWRRCCGLESFYRRDAKGWAAYRGRVFQTGEAFQLPPGFRQEHEGPAAMNAHALAASWVEQGWIVSRAAIYRQAMMPVWWGEKRGFQYSCFSSAAHHHLNWGPGGNNAVLAYTRRKGHISCSLSKVHHTEPLSFHELVPCWRTWVPPVDT
jgi:hypothetical protein